MNLAGAGKSFFNPKGRFFQATVIIIISSIVLFFIILLNDGFFNNSDILLYGEIWHRLLEFSSLFIALSIFFVSYYTYPQTKNTHLLIAGFAFLTVGLLYLIDVLDIGCILDPGGIRDYGKSLTIWMAVRFICAGAYFFLSSKKLRMIETGRCYPALATIAIVAAIYAGICFFPFARGIFRDTEGFSPPGLIMMALAGLIYLYSYYRISKEYGKTENPFYKLISIAVLLLFISENLLMLMNRMYDIWSILSQIYQAASFIIMFNAFYADSIQRPYILLSKAKEELNGYLSELDQLVDRRTIELRAMYEKLMADQEIARGIQLSMLPSSLPHNEYAAFSAGYVPAEKLSGDFYNVIKIDEYRFGFCIGDVSGHGVSAAMLSIFGFQKMQSLMEETGGGGMSIPSVVLKHLYESFNAANFNDDMYIVMLYGVFDTQSGILSYASGGLNTIPLRIRPDGSIQELDNDGFAICKLGEILKPKFVNHQVLLFPGDKLVVYTDGLIDARGADNSRYTLERLKKTIIKHYKWGVAHLKEAIVTDVLKHTGEKPADDVTVLILDVLPPF